MNDMVDMSLFTEAKSDQLNSDDLIGGPRTITVTRVTGAPGDQPVAIFYAGDNNRPFKPCKTMRRILMGVWGKHAQDYVGRSMTLYRDDGVTFGGLEVGGTRISHMSHMDGEVMVVVNKTKGKKVGIKIRPLVMEAEQKPFTLDEARTDLQLAATMDELAATWKRKIMAPHREALADELAKCKLALAEPEGGKSDDDMGEPARPITEHMLEMDAATGIDALGLAFDAAVADYPEERDALTRLRTAKIETFKATAK